MKDQMDPIAFLSYVRSDDEHDSGRISELRRQLQGEVKMQTGLPFNIFQDRNDIHWGQQWKDRIEEALMGATLLIPVITPSFFRSHACREEFSTFLLREKQLGEKQLILPIYYVRAQQIEDADSDRDEIVSTVKARNWADWRDFRFDPLTDPKIRAATSVLAGDIIKAINRLQAVMKANQGEGKVERIKEPESLVAPDPDGAPTLFSRKVAGVKLVSEERKDSPYTVYTTEFDEVIKAADLLEDTAAVSLHSRLLKKIRLEMDYLSTREMEQVSSALVHSSTPSQICVTILLDNSGSLRGNPIEVIAAASSMACRYLSEAGVPNEVLGYTTRAWKGGQSREKWLANGRPTYPGRLNDLRHIVYKDFLQTFQEADIGFAAMLKEGILKENIDGEALPWAASRILQRPEPRKILLVVSDGAPVDDSTLSVNHASILEKHLLESILAIRTENSVEIYGVGLNHDVTRYFGPSPSSNLKYFARDFLLATSLALSGNWSNATKIKRPSDEKGGKKVKGA